MINILNKVDCCGCNACGDVCTHEAISFKTDNEGFWYPQVNKKNCVDCGLCEKVCPIISKTDLPLKNVFEPPLCYAAVHKNLEIRFDSTSGGLFTAFAEKILKDGGLVGGAIYTDDLYVEQILISDKKELEKLRGSKYMQSNFSGFYRSIKSALKDGKKVLVCGSPCQMAAVRTFLRKDYENLYVLDYVCRGIASPLIFHKYLDYLERRVGSKAIYCKFKIKDLGWRNRALKIGFKNGIYLFLDKNNSLHDLGYHRTKAFCRPSCYDCKFVGIPRYSDVTLADFWGIESFNKNPELDRDMGTSLIMCNNSKGVQLFESIKKYIIFEQTSFEQSVKYNPALFTSHPSPIVDRDLFFKRLSSEDFGTLINELINNSNKQPKVVEAKRFIKNVLRRAKVVASIIRQGIKPTYLFLRYNSFKAILSQEQGLLLPSDNVVMDFHKSSRIVVKEGFLKLGYKRVKGSSLELRLLMEKDSELVVGGSNTFFYGGDVELFKGAKLYMGKGTGFNINCSIICANSIIMGDNVAIGRNVTIRDNNGGHYISRQGYKNSKPVVIGDHVWLCEGCVIMPGAHVGAGAIVSAGAVVYGYVPPFTMVSGNPAKVIDNNIYWKH